MTTLRTRLAVVESAHGLRTVQQAFEQILLDAGVEAGVPCCTLEAMGAAMVKGHRAYPRPPHDWLTDPDRVNAVVQDHLAMLSRVLGTYLPDPAVQWQVRAGMSQRLAALARAHG
jgi:hypothetical protein